MRQEQTIVNHFAGRDLMALMNCYCLVVKAIVAWSATRIGCPLNKWERFSIRLITQQLLWDDLLACDHLRRRRGRRLLRRPARGGGPGRRFRRPRRGPPRDAR